MIKKKDKRENNNKNLIIYWSKLINNKKAKMLKSYILNLRIEKNTIYFPFFLF